MEERKCLYCNAEITEGRRDKKYCNAHCRSAFQYSENVNNEPTYHKVKKALSKNRLIMKRYNKSGFAAVRKETLIKEGFDPKYNTHSWRNRKGEEYRFVFEFGFLEDSSSTHLKYKLVTWQDYMN